MSAAEEPLEEEDLRNEGKLSRDRVAVIVKN
jgi:hypothetical protein